MDPSRASGRKDMKEHMYIRVTSKLMFEDKLLLIHVNFVPVASGQNNLHFPRCLL